MMFDTNKNVLQELETKVNGTTSAEGANVARERFFYDITFFIIVTTIGLNIVFGIIVDTFSELRDEKVSYHYLSS